MLKWKTFFNAVQVAEGKFCLLLELNAVQIYTSVISEEFMNKLNGDYQVFGWGCHGFATWQKSVQLLVLNMCYHQPSWGNLQPTSSSEILLAPSNFPVSHQACQSYNPKRSQIYVFTLRHPLHNWGPSSSFRKEVDPLWTRQDSQIPLTVGLLLI